ncbi:VasL domain-containing protein, partial [Escherichia coli]|nr:VasL domain-containing protein [Escherichia coli]
ELKRVPRVENLLYFMQNTRKRLEPQLKSNTENSAQTSVIKQGSTVRGFIAGIACSVAVASALWWWQVYPVQQ